MHACTFVTFCKLEGDSPSEESAALITCLWCVSERGRPVVVHFDLGMNYMLALNVSRMCCVTYMYINVCVCACVHVYVAALGCTGDSPSQTLVTILLLETSQIKCVDMRNMGAGL